MTLDPHVGQMQGFFSIPGDVLTASRLIIDEIRTTLLPRLRNPVVVATDLGFAKKARKFAADLGMPVAFIEKRRAGNESRAEALSLIGSVKGSDAIVVDDEVDTGSSIIQAIQVAKENGALDVYLAFVHAILPGDAAKNLAALPLKRIITTDTVPINAIKMRALKDRITVLSVSALLGEVIRRAHEGRSVGEMFNE